MKRTTKATRATTLIPVFALAIAAALVRADDAPKKGNATPTTAAATSDAYAGMWANMKTMQAQMARIQATTDPKERTKLLDEHLKTMQATMQTMMANGGCMGSGPMMRGGMGGNMPMMQGSTGGGNTNLMQLMMEQMAQHQNAMHAPPK